MPCILAFPAKSDAMCVVPLREEWLAQIENQTEIEIDCSVVETMTAAAAQLVFSLAKTLSPTGGTVKLAHVSEALGQDLTLLGLKDFLKEQAQHG